MNITAHEICSALQAIKEKAPVIHNITNYVVMNSTANALLAIGASPVMAHAEEEMEEMVGIASALVINIGTLSPAWVRAMHRAAEAARKRRIPIVLDPVGAGATSYRTRTAREFVKAVPPEIIRGNASEIMALLDSTAKTKGVDSSASSDAAVEIGRALHAACGAVVCISGETDYTIGPRGGDPGPKRPYHDDPRDGPGLHGVGPLRGLCRGRVRPCHRRRGGDGRSGYRRRDRRHPFARAGHAPGPPARRPLPPQCRRHHTVSQG